MPSHEKTYPTLVASDGTILVVRNPRQWDLDSDYTIRELNYYVPDGLSGPAVAVRAGRSHLFPGSNKSGENPRQLFIRATATTRPPQTPLNRGEHSVANLEISPAGFSYPPKPEQIEMYDSLMHAIGRQVLNDLEASAALVAIVQTR